LIAQTAPFAGHNDNKFHVGVYFSSPITEIPIGLSGGSKTPEIFRVGKPELTINRSMGHGSDGSPKLDESHSFIFTIPVM
jgi:hypothetical protein